MTTRELPESLKGICTRKNDNLSKEMMSKFKKLTDEYNKQADDNFNKDTSISNDVLNFDENNVFNMIKKAKLDVKAINDNNSKLYKKIEEYNQCKNDCRTLIESIENISHTYYNLSTTSQLVDIANKLQIKQHIIDVEFTSKIANFENDIKVKIDELNEQIKNNNKKLSDFKKLVLQCSADEENENEKNMCSVCITRKINTCLNPCGHTFCLTCVDKMNNKCGMCRSSFISKIKMYIVNDETLEESDNEDTNANEDLFIQSFEGFHSLTFANVNMPVSSASFSNFPN